MSRSVPWLVVLMTLVCSGPASAQLDPQADGSGQDQPNLVELPGALPNLEEGVDPETAGGPLRKLLEELVGVDSWVLAEGFLLENWQWMGLLALILIGVILERISTRVFFRLARRYGKSESVQVGEKGVRNFVRPFGLLVMAWAFTTLLPLLSLPHGIEEILDIAVSGILAVAGVWAAIRFVDVVCDFLRAKAQKTENKFDDMLVPLLRRTLKIFVVVVGVVYIASKLTDDIWKVMAGLSLGSVAVGFAAKDSIENLFGTFTVLLDKPFQLGDWITVGVVDGTVEKVGIRSTRIRTFYNSLISVPNSQFISATVDNWGARRYRRIKTTLGLTYDTPPEKIEAFCEGIREIIRVHPYTRKDYYHVYLNEFSSASLTVLLYCFVEVPDWSMELREKHRLFADILRLAERLDVEFAFPTQTIHVAKPEDLEHPDRPKSDQAGAKVGRRAGQEIAIETLAPYGKDKPGRVKFSRSTPLEAPGDEGDGGE